MAWTKQEQPFLGLPPADMPLVGWRDPFIFEFKGQDGFQEWGMLLGSGIKGQGGSIMIYRSSELTGGAPPTAGCATVVFKLQQGTFSCRTVWPAACQSWQEVPAGEPTVARPETASAG